MIEDDVFKRTRSWLMAATQLAEVGQSHREAVWPDTNYGTLNLIRSARIGRLQTSEVIDHPDDPGDGSLGYLHIGNRAHSWTFRFNVYHKYALNVLNRLPVWYLSDTGQLAAYPLIVHSVSDPVRLPYEAEANYNVLATVDIEVQAQITTLHHNADGSPGSITDPPSPSTVEFLGGVSMDLVDPAAIDLLTDYGRDIQANLNPRPLTPDALQSA